MHCQRTREWLSLAVDSELSQFERALVRAHVERCADCRVFDAELQGITATLRRSALVPLPRPVAMPRWRQRRVAPARIARLGSAVAATAAVFVGAFLVPDRAALGIPGERSLIAAPLARPSSTNDLIVAVQRTALEQGKSSSIAFGAGGIGVYKAPITPNPR